jgi:hypothetical protein
MFVVLLSPFFAHRSLQSLADYTIIQPKADVKKLA